MLLIANVAFGQTDSTKVQTFYCEARSYFDADGCTLGIDFGDKKFYYSDDCKVCNNGKIITFLSDIQALNYILERGWKLEKMFVMPGFTVFFLSKFCALRNLKEGFELVGDKKKKK